MQNWIEKLGLGERAASMVVWIGLSVFLLVVVLALAVWLIKTLRPSLHIGGSHGRSGRPQRLAITDAFTLDRDGRKLVIIRRDNVEHLLLIGGPNDVLIEPCIVRGERSQRDRGARGGMEAETLHTAEASPATEIPHAEAPTMPTMAPSTPVNPPVMAPITLPPFRPSAPPSPPKSPAPARLDDEFERALAAMQAAQRQQAAQRPPPPVSAAPHPVAPAPHPHPPEPPPAPQPRPAATQPTPERTTRQEPVSEMARRLNEVLQKPLSGTLRPPFNRPIPPVPATLNSAPKPASVTSDAPSPVAPEPPSAAASVPAPPPARPIPSPAAEPAAPGVAESEMDLLEEEMARLLGRTPEPKKPGPP